jgi:hypothetical protein
MYEVSLNIIIPWFDTYMEGFMESFFDITIW